MGFVMLEAVTTIVVFIGAIVLISRLLGMIKKEEPKDESKKKAG